MITDPAMSTALLALTLSGFVVGVGASRAARGELGLYDAAVLILAAWGMWLSVQQILASTC